MKSARPTEVKASALSQRPHLTAAVAYLYARCDSLAVVTLAAAVLAIEVLA